jgi:Fic-DOC domain mobile mystery protein B
VSGFYFKDREGQTPLPPELQKGLIPKTINTLGELDEFEEANIAIGLSWLDQYSKDDYLNFGFWMTLHKHLFNEVWKWAGQIRDHELANPYFRLPYQIRPELKKLEEDLKYWFAHQTYSDQEIAAHFHERIEAIHPFANGNGRFGRILTEYISKRKEHRIPTWGEALRQNPPKRRAAYIASLNHARDTYRYDLLVKFMFS